MSVSFIKDVYINLDNSPEMRVYFYRILSGGFIHHQIQAEAILLYAQKDICHADESVRKAAMQSIEKGLKIYPELKDGMLDFFVALAAKNRHIKPSGEPNEVQSWAYNMLSGAEQKPPDRLKALFDRLFQKGPAAFEQIDLINKMGFIAELVPKTADERFVVGLCEVIGSSDSSNESDERKLAAEKILSSVLDKDRPLAKKAFAYAQEAAQSKDWHRRITATRICAITAGIKEEFEKESLSLLEKLALKDRRADVREGAVDAFSYAVRRNAGTAPTLVGVMKNLVSPKNEKGEMVRRKAMQTAIIAVDCYDRHKEAEENKKQQLGRDVVSMAQESLGDPSLEIKADTLRSLLHCFPEKLLPTCATQDLVSKVLDVYDDNKKPSNRDRAIVAQAASDFLDRLIDKASPLFETDTPKGPNLRKRTETMFTHAQKIALIR